MAVFPTRADFRRPTPRVDVSVATYRTGRAAEIGTEDVQTQFEQGKQTQTTGEMLLSLSAQLDETAALEAVTQFRAKRQEMTFDPQKGFKRLKGGEVMQPGPGGKPLLDELPMGLQQEADAISAKLITPGAKAMFAKATASEVGQFKREFIAHMDGQTDVYQAATFKDAQTMALGLAAASFEDPAKIEGIATRAERAAMKYAGYKGLDGTAAGMAARSNVYRVAVESLLASGNNRQALTYYDNVAPKLDGPDRVALQARLKSTATEVEAENVVTGYGGLAVPQAVQQYAPLIQKAAADHGVRPALLTGLVAQESGGNPGAVSSAGARGLTQLMPGTAGDLGVTNPHDETQAVPAGARYLKQQLVKYDGNERLALMAYNWGPGSVDKWLKAGADPEKIPAETRNYVQRVQGYAASVGGGKGDIASAKLDIFSRTDLPTAVKASAVTMMEKKSAAFEAWKAAESKNLEDNARVVLSTAMLDPANYQDGTLLAYADRFEAVGKGEEATRFRVLAAMEGTLKNFMGSATDAQRATVSEFLKGLPKEIADSVTKGDTKGRGEAKARAAEAFAVLQTAAKDNIDQPGLEKQAREAITHYNTAGDHEGARKVAQFYENAIATRAVVSQSPAAAAQSIAELKTLADSGKATAQQLELHHAMLEGMQRQATAFAKDAFAAGTRLYPDLGAPAPLDWGQPANLPAALAARAQQARQISARRDNMEVLPFSEPEIAMLRQQIDAAPPDQQGRIMQTLAALPADMMPRVAIALAGKSGEKVSRGYTAAMGLIGEADPGSREVATEILKGTQIMRADGGGGRKPAQTSNAWLTELQTLTGDSLRAVHAETREDLNAAIAAVYVSRMHNAGKQGDSTDIDVLRSSARAVLGEAISYKGNMLFPPTKGMTTYQFNAAVNRLRDSDLPGGLKTLEGDPVTADAIKQHGRLRTVGTGRYLVEMPDARAGGVLRPILDPRKPNDGFILDVAPLLGREGPPLMSPDVRPVPITPLMAPSDYGRRR